MALAKFNSSGQLLWVKKMGNGTFDMEPQGVNLDGSGNPYWAGSFAGSITFPGAPNVALTAAGSYDAFTARFDPVTGNCLWAKRVGGAGNDYLYACFVSNSGNVYAGGSYSGVISFQTGATSVSLPNAGGLDGFIVKFDPNGNGIYASRFGSTQNDEVKSMEYNGGDLVACGYMGNNASFPGTSGAITLPSIGGSRDGWAARINSTGQYVWVKNFGTIFNDEATSICMDPSTGNVFTAAQVADAPLVFNGISHAPNGGNDIAVLGWNFYTQAPVWAKRVGSTIGDSPTSIRWDGLRLVVAGYGGLPFTINNDPICCSSGQDGLLLRYDKTNGTVTSAGFIGGNGNDRALALWCNTTTREAIVGGGFSGTTAFPGDFNDPFRTSNGGMDGFIAIYPASSAAREAQEETLVFQAGLKLYPQPVCVGGTLTVKSNLEGPAQLMDMQGRVLKIINLKAGENTLEAPQTQGLYMLRVGKQALKVVVQ